jgi:hypothetical protein
MGMMGSGLWVMGMGRKVRERGWKALVLFCLTITYSVSCRALVLEIHDINDLCL